MSDKAEVGAPRSAIWRRQAEAIVKELFVNGAGEQADRLVLTVDGPPRRYLGGWGRLPAIDHIETVLRAGAEALAPPAPNATIQIPVTGNMSSLEAMGLFRRHAEDLPPRSHVYPASAVDQAFAGIPERLQPSNLPPPPRADARDKKAEQ